jgi:hypothetical protein
VKLKLDLHPIFSDSRLIESALLDIIQQAEEKHATEVEIIPGKGSGALKKSVIRFLDRPEIKSRFHRLEKDSDNWGRLSLHFRHTRSESVETKARPTTPPTPTISGPCACCGETFTVPDPDYSQTSGSYTLDCPWCGSPNRITFWRDGRGSVHLRAKLDYPES